MIEPKKGCKSYSLSKNCENQDGLLPSKKKVTKIFRNLSLSVQNPFKIKASSRSPSIISQTSFASIISTPIFNRKSSNTSSIDKCIDELPNSPSLSFSSISSHTSSYRKDLSISSLSSEPRSLDSLHLPKSSKRRTLNLPPFLRIKSNKKPVFSDIKSPVKNRFSWNTFLTSNAKTWDKTLPRITICIPSDEGDESIHL